MTRGGSHCEREGKGQRQCYAVVWLVALRLTALNSLRALASCSQPPPTFGRSAIELIDWPSASRARRGHLLAKRLRSLAKQVQDASPDLRLEYVSSWKHSHYACLGQARQAVEADVPHRHKIIINITKTKNFDQRSILLTGQPPVVPVVGTCLQSGSAAVRLGGLGVAGC